MRAHRPVGAAPEIDEDAMFLRNCWYVAAWNYELIDGAMLSRRILGDKILFYRGESGKVVALDDRCCHRGAPLSMGRCEGDDVRCMYHGLLFAPSGKCIQIPGQDKIPPSLVVRSFPVHEKYGLIWVWTGDPAAADPDLIVDLPYMVEPQWKGIPAYLHYDANYLLIIDNLSDFAHLAFVHTNTLGGSEEYAFKTKPVAVERLEDGFRVERWNMNAPPPLSPQGHSEQERQCRQAQCGPYAHSRNLLAGNHFRAGGQRGRKGKSGRRAPVSQLPVHDPRDRADDALLPCLSERL